MNRTLFSMFAALALASASCGRDATAHPPGDAAFPRVGDEDRRAVTDSLEMKEPPELRTESWVHGDVTNFARLKGKVICVVFWGCWSEESLNLLAPLNALHEKLESKGLYILGVHTQRAKDDTERTVADRNVTFPVVIDAESDPRSGGVTSDAFMVAGEPAIYLIDRQGRLRFADITPRDLERITKYLLNEKAK